MIRLTDEEIERVMTTYDKLGIVACAPDFSPKWANIAKAQLKKVVEWGEEICIGLNLEPLKRRQCSHCWQALLEEVNNGKESKK